MEAAEKVACKDMYSKKKKKKFGGMPSFFPLKETGENVNTLPLIDSHRAFYETNK